MTWVGIKIQAERGCCWFGSNCRGHAGSVVHRGVSKEDAPALVTATTQYQGLMSVSLSKSSYDHPFYFWVHLRTCLLPLRSENCLQVSRLINSRVLSIVVRVIVSDRFCRVVGTCAQMEPDEDWTRLLSETAWPLIF